MIFQLFAVPGGNTPGTCFLYRIEWGKNGGAIITIFLQFGKKIYTLPP